MEMGVNRRQILQQGAIGGVAVVGCGGLFDQARADVTLLKPPLYGKATAPKRLVVWGSCTCPFTVELFRILVKVLRDIPDAASVEWHHFPVHDEDPALHVASLAFTGAHFWGFTFNVMVWSRTKGMPTNEKLIEFAKAEGGSEETLKAAYADKAKWAAVKEDMLAGQLLGVTVTPGLFYNGYYMTPEGLPRDTAAFEKSLRAMLQTG
jgi:protein-disulfide isomerase